MMRFRAGSRLTRVICAFPSLICTSLVWAQGPTTTLAVNDPRPVAAAAMEVERLSGVPVNYEDLRYENPADLQDITDQIMTPAQKAQATPGVRVIVPRGGTLSVPVYTDADGRLSDFSSVVTALNALVSAYATSPVRAGSFTVELGNGVVYIEPSQVRDAAGNTDGVHPVLSTPVTFPPQSRTGFDTVRMILDQVSQASGLKLDLGTAPMGVLASFEIEIGASNEPASHVISRLLAALATAGAAVPYSGPAMSYSMYFDPRLKFYALNVHFVPNPNARKGTGPALNPQTNSGRFFKTTK